MLPKKHRLQLRKSPLYFSEARKKFFPGFSIFVLPKEQSNEALIAIIVPKANIAKSTARNKIKRKISEELSPILSNLKGKQIAIIWRSREELKTLLSLKEALLKYCS